MTYEQQIKFEMQGLNKQQRFLKRNKAKISAAAFARQTKAITERRAYLTHLLTA